MHWQCIAYVCLHETHTLTDLSVAPFSRRHMRTVIVMANHTVTTAALHAVHVKFVLIMCFCYRYYKTALTLTYHTNICMYYFIMIVKP